MRYDLDDYARDDFFRAYTTDLSLLLAMKDFWSRADFDKDDRLRAEMLKLEKELEKF